LLLTHKKVPDRKEVFDNSLTSAPFDTIFYVVQYLASLVRVPVLNLNCFALSKPPLESFLVKRIQRS
jgi:hypothetical protein